MADPLSISASIIGILQLSAVVVQHISSMKGASDERNKILNEIGATSDLLAIINNPVRQVQHGDSWQSLRKPGGPLGQLEAVLRELEKKLTPATGWTKVKNAVTWPFKKGEIEGFIGSIERQKTLLGLAVQNDHMWGSLSKWNCCAEYSY
jgi:hypothetical protein